MSAGSFRVAIAGNPNVGKTSLFNHLTASRYRVGNYPGVTVESREGGLAPRYRQAQAGAFDGELSLVDLPGSYSLAPNSEDELIAYRCLAGRLEAQAAPDAVLVVLDATNLARNLYFLLQIRELGLPCIVALNMVDEAKRASLSVDPEELARELGMPVVPTIARDGVGLEGLVRAIAKVAAGDRGPRVEKENAGEEAQTGSVLEGLLERLSEVADGPGRARWLLSAAAVEEVEGMGIEIAERAVLDGCSEEEIDAAVRQLISIRYAKVDAILAGLEGGSPVREGEAPAMERSRKIRPFAHALGDGPGRLSDRDGADFPVDLQLGGPADGLDRDLDRRDRRRPVLMDGPRLAHGPLGGGCRRRGRECGRLRAADRPALPLYRGLGGLGLHGAGGLYHRSPDVEGGPARTRLRPLAFGVRLLDPGDPQHAHDQQRARSLGHHLDDPLYELQRSAPDLRARDRSSI